MLRSNKILEVTGASSTSYNYQIGAGHINALFFETDAPANVTLQVMLKSGKSEVLVNSITLDKLEGISDFNYGCGSSASLNRAIVEGTDNETTIEGAYPQYLASATVTTAIIVPLGSIYFKAGEELHVNITLGATSTALNVSELSFNTEPQHYLQLTQYTNTNETYNNVVQAFLYRGTYNHVADVQIVTKRFGSSINSLNQLNSISSAMGRAESFRNYYSTCVFMADKYQPESIQIKLSGTNSTSITTIIMTIYVNPYYFVQTQVENIAVAQNNTVVANVNAVKKQKKLNYKPGLGIAVKGLKSLTA